METQITSLLDDLGAKAARIRYGASKRLMLLSESKPGDLYPYWDRFVELLSSSYRILRWNAAHILANLTAVDDEHRFDGIFNAFFQPIDGDNMISAANVIGASPAIVRARPDLLPKVLERIFRVNKANYQTATCRDIAIGHACTALGQMELPDREKAKVIEFAQAHLKNDRNGTVKKVQKLLKLLSR